MLSLKSLVPKRRWLRFSLATFLLAIAVIAYGCKWVLDRVNLCANQYKLLASLSVYGPDGFRGGAAPVPRGGGGEGGSHNGKEIGAFNWGFAEPNGWEKTVAVWLGINYEVDVVLLGILGKRVDLAKDMEVALKMPKLKNFFLHGEPVTEDVTAALSKMKCLESLSFTDTAITDDAVAALKGMDGLKTLAFMATDVTKDTAADLKSVLPQTHILVYREEPENKDEPNGKTKYVVAIDLP